MERFPPRKPEELATAEDKSLYNELSDIKDNLFGDHFILKQADGSFAGPFATAYALPNAFRAFINTASALAQETTPVLPKSAREAAILVVGVYYDSTYEIYAHERLASLAGLTWRQISHIKEGRKPPSSGEDALDDDCDVAYDVAVELLEGSGRKGRLSDEVWQRAVDRFGREGALGLIHYVGYYAYACLMMNGAGVGMPVGESLKASAL